MSRPLSSQFGYNVAMTDSVWLDRPSFYFKIHEARRIDELTAQARGVHRHEVWSFDSKIGGREVASRAGVRIPDLLQGPDVPERIDWRALRVPFVCKPVNGSGGAGVRVLIPTGTGRFCTLDRSRVYDEEELVQYYQRLAELKRISSRIYVEEAILAQGKRPFDWKFYTFRGRIGAILQIRRSGPRREYRYYGADWRLLGNVRLDVEDFFLPPPSFPDELSAAARRISLLLPVPFARIDFYEAQEGVVFGEISPRIGGAQQFLPWLDEFLGRMWQEAEVDLREARFKGGQRIRREGFQEEAG